MSSKYGKIINFRAYDKQLSILTHLSAKYHMKKSQIIRNLINHAVGVKLTNPITTKMINELENIRANLYRSGGNINQIAHAANIYKKSFNARGYRSNVRLIQAIKAQIISINNMKTVIKNIEKKI